MAERSSNKMTRATHERLKQALLEAQQDYAHALQTIGETGGKSDWHDNFAFEQAHRDAQRTGAILRDLQRQLDAPQFIMPRDDVSHIGLGNKVSVQFEDDGSTEQIYIGGQADQIYNEGFISDESPVGSAILGKRKNESVEIKRGDKVINKVRILDVEPGDFE